MPVIRKQLSSGELHPLRISFDSPSCLYPLKISAVSGKPSEVSLYILAAEALTDKFILNKELEKLEHLQEEWNGTMIGREAVNRRFERDERRMRLATTMYSLATSGDRSSEDSQSMSRDEIERLVEDGAADGKIEVPAQLPPCRQNCPFVVDHHARRGIAVEQLLRGGLLGRRGGIAVARGGAAPVIAGVRAGASSSIMETAMLTPPLLLHRVALK